MTSPSRKLLDQLNLLRRDFIWVGKSAKIKHSTLNGSYAKEVTKMWILNPTLSL